MLVSYFFPWYLSLTSFLCTLSSSRLTKVDNNPGEVISVFYNTIKLDFFGAKKYKSKRYVKIYEKSKIFRRIQDIIFKTNETMPVKVGEKQFLSLKK